MNNDAQQQEILSPPLPGMERTPQRTRRNLLSDEDRLLLSHRAAQRQRERRERFRKLHVLANLSRHRPRGVAALHKQLNASGLACYTRREVGELLGELVREGRAVKRSQQGFLKT